VTGVVGALFDEFAARYARGEEPDVEEYLERAGRGRDSLGRLIDRYLQTAPARPPSAEELALLDARLERDPPLLALRLRRRQRVDDVVDALVSGLGLGADARAKVKVYYQKLEFGLLDPARVSDRVWAVLGERARALAEWEPAAVPAHGVLLRADLSVESLSAPESLEKEPPEETEPDEVDRLFQS
jgi:hypothetical protein